MRPSHISPKYLHLLINLMRESGYPEPMVIRDFGVWLNTFKDWLNSQADLIGRPVAELYPSYNDFVDEELRLQNPDRI